MTDITHHDHSTETGLALSGGGFRATLFHLGALAALNDKGWLSRVAEFTSVSGGSIIAAFLAYRWRQLQFDQHGRATNFKDEIAVPIQEFCSRTSDIGSIAKGWLNPLKRPSEYLAERYDEDLFKGATLQDLPGEDMGPRFTIYATNLQTGVSVRMSRAYLADYKLGMFDSPTVPLAVAVAASSAFPPIFVPVVLKLDPSKWRNVQGSHLFDRVDMRSTLLLGDGGIYDNMGLERIWDSFGMVLVSDAGAPLDSEDSSFWLKISEIARAMRTLDIAIEQSRALRKRKLIDDFKSRAKAGTYWGITTKIADYGLETAGRVRAIIVDSTVTAGLARMRTRLNSFSPEEQGRLINWGYALADAAMRRHVLDANSTPGQLPFPEYSL